MALVQDIVFTALPDGLTDDKTALRASVFVSPRLQPNGGFGRLSDFADLREWPRTLHRARFFLEINGTLREADFDAARAEPALWNELFADNTPVGSPKFNDISGRELRSFPARRIVQYIRGLYRDVAEQSPTAFPPTDGGPLRGLRAGLGAGHPPVDPRDERARPETDDELDALRRRSREPGFDGRTGRERRLDQMLKGGATPTVAPEVLDFYQATRFYNRPEMREVYGERDPDAVPPQPEQPEPDFHQFLNSLNDFPEILRRLGLVVDVTVPADFTVPASGTVRARVEIEDLRNGLGSEPFPATAFLFDERRFQAAPQPQISVDHRNGMLTLENGDFFDVAEIDLDGAAIKVDDFAANLERMLSDRYRATTKPENVSVPALRSSGLTVTRFNRKDKVEDRVAKAKQDAGKFGSGKVTLYADDLVRGYRVEVFDDHTGEWHSLCRRDGRYRLGATTLEHSDEGFVKNAGTTSKPGDDKAPLYLHEAVFGWDGWSLSAARPGKVLPGPEEGETPREITERATTAFPFDVEFQPAPGSLPRLRYGWRYRLRARLVDLAGNSPRVPDDNHVTPEVAFRRFEPVPPPVVVPTARFTEGESLQRLVIRSNVGLTPAQYVAKKHVKDALAKYDHTYSRFSERHIAAPKSSQREAELHEMFEASIGAGKDYKRWFNLALKEEGTFLDTKIVDIKTGKKTITVTGIELVSPAGLTGAPTLTTLGKGDPLEPGQYVIHTAAKLKLPYLPDPMSRGAAFAGLPELTPFQVARVPVTDKWPDATPFRLRLMGDDNPPGYTLNPDGTLTFGDGVVGARVPQGEVVTVRMSSFVTAEDLDRLGIWGWMGPEAQNRFKEAAVNGQCWMLTPYDELTLVHAVQQPLEEPVLPDSRDFAPARSAGETFAWFEGHIENHAKTTVQLDVEATWDEPVDIITDPEPRVVTGTGHAFDFKLEVDENEAAVYREDEARSGSKPPRHRARHEFGDTKHRWVRYTPVATTRFREYFPPEITSVHELITRTGPEREIDIPSSARPDAPKVLYIVPTFRWDEKVGKGASPSIQRSRLTGLRVYLDRPWYSSGDDELLGVVVRQSSPRRRNPDLIDRFTRDVTDLVRAVRTRTRFTAPVRTPADLRKLIRAADRIELSATHTRQAGRLKDAIDGLLDKSAIIAALGDPSGPYVSHWGTDPLWNGASLPADDPTASSFTRSEVVHGERLLLSEVPSGPRVAVVGHPVEYNPDRKLWFCDIDIDAGSAFFPFLRLALARYQPHSIAGVELSKVVVADFAQLAADRTASVSFSRSSARVTVSGPAGQREPRLLAASRVVTATVQALDPKIGTDLGWVDVAAPVALADNGLRVGVATWTGRVPLPDDDGRERRILIQELEILPGDALPSERIGERPGSRVARNERVVYADVIPV